MKHSYPSEANNSSASKEIPLNLWSSNIHYRLHKIAQLVPVLSQINPFHDLLTDLITFLVLSSIYVYVFQVFSFP